MAIDPCMSSLFVSKPSSLLTMHAENGKKIREAAGIFEYVRAKALGLTFIPCYAVSDSAADTIVDLAATLGVSRLLLGSPQRRSLLDLLRGNIIRQVFSLLPDNIHLLVHG